VLLGLQIVPALAMLIGSYWMPSSPRWLVMKGRHDEALEVLRLMHGSDSDDDTFYLREYHQIKSQLELENGQHEGIWGIIRNRRYWRRASMPVIFYFLLVCTGIIPLQNYQVIVYTALGMSNKLSLILTGVWGTTGTVVNISSALIMDRISRRACFFIAISICLVGSILLTGFWAAFDASGSQSALYGRLSIFAMFVYLVGESTLPNTCYPFQYSWLRISEVTLTLP
jgi:hypothetical protein